MEFARKQLEKYGWSDGKGLGKYETGISEPLKAKIKHSLTGVGYDPAADFTEHWWSTLYDKAASNLEVENKDGKTKKIQRKSKDEFEITNSTWKLKKKKKEIPKDNEQYSELFVKTAVIGQGGDITTRVRDSDSESDDEDDTKDKVKLTDEELYVACQGRTAHKGARHGLKALGKLLRIEQQEQILIQQLKYKGYTQHEKIKYICKEDSQIVEDANLNSQTEMNPIKKKNKKKKIRCTSTVTRSNEIQEAEQVPKDSEAVYENDLVSGRKPTKSKHKTDEENTQAEIPEETEIMKTRKKKKYQCDRTDDCVNVQVIDNLSNDSVTKNENNALIIGRISAKLKCKVNVDIPDHEGLKRKKKKKNHHDKIEDTN
ncbi:G patch domain-containing protein 4 [Pararge aegeria]|uniref:G patch domain-containing protein 4 n=2 Tax=Pararge aegeria TaxID=116150 RepID=A0A8S4S3N3_9NEOP|nr:G patch domain-containing protein 4 [Pararge aegeria]CAH2249661.1 jg18811 [Pararge aegeria aegeria]